MSMSTLTGSCKRRRVAGKTSPVLIALLEAVGAEDGGANMQVYLITVSRVFRGTAAASGFRDVEGMSRAELRDLVRDAFDDPIPADTGRPRTRGSILDFVITAKEKHADGTVHFHVVVKLSEKMRFKQVKLTLQERHKLPSHVSCSHAHVWSAVRYLHVATPRKPDTDKALDVWTWDGRSLDLDEISKEPFIAKAWDQRRVKLEAAAVLQEKKAPGFNKLDLTALIIAKHLHTKAALMSYVQDFASAPVQLYVNKHQRRLVEYIEDAQEWAEAKVTAGLEKMTDWELLCKAAGQPCAHPPGACSYAVAVEEIFKRNAGTLSPHKLAAALKNVLVGGPSKTCRVPFLVGPSNTGKSTLLYPFDDLFGPKRVFHKPALGSTFALRNITKGKRFIFWDDYRPVEYAHEKTVPTSAFLSLFIGKNTEIQASQSFSDGNPDVQWNRGVVFTAKSEGLWEPTVKVSPEDIRHIRNRVEEFQFASVVSDLKDVESCASCMARWIRKYSTETPPPPPVAAGDVGTPGPTSASVAGFVEKMASVKLTGEIVDCFLADVVATGAVHINELALADWQGLPTWKKLRPMEVRRLASAIGQ